VALGVAVEGPLSAPMPSLMLVELQTSVEALVSASELLLVLVELQAPVEELELGDVVEEPELE